MKKRFALCLFFVTTYISFSFAEDLPSGVFSMQECRECLRRFYRFEAIDEKLLASSAEKLEGIIFSFLNARSPSVSRGSIRAYRGVRSERIERFDPSVSRGSIRASKECSLDQASHVQDLWSLYLEHAYVISAIYDLGGMKDYSSLIERLKTKVELFMKAIKPNAKIYLKYADYLYLSLAQGNAKAVHALPILYRKVLLLDKNNKEALVKLASWYIFPANEKTANINGFIEEAETYIDELEVVDLFNACLWYSIYYMKNYNVNKGFDYLQRANRIFPRHVYVAHLWNNYKNGIFRM